jgi:Hint domain
LVNSSRRSFIKSSTNLAGKIAATGVVSLPLLASMSKKTWAWAGGDWRNFNPPGGGGHCFLRGTRIRTPEGEIAVEDFTIGTLVDTLNGPLPIKWIGRQRFRKDSASWHWSVAPICVARFALSDQYPHRDLYLSPHHSLLIDGFLIPVQWLVNGRSIVLDAFDNGDVVDYFHIELETHEVVYAEGTPAETLLITHDREHFSNFVEYERRYGAEMGGAAMKPFAPVLEYRGARGELERLLRLAVSPVLDIRDPIQRARAEIAARANSVETEKFTN